MCFKHIYNKIFAKKRYIWTNDKMEDITHDDSAKIIYKETLRLYDLEMESYGILTNKTNGIIVFNAAIIAFITSAFIQLIILVIKNEMSFSLILLVFPYVFLIISLSYAIRSYKTTNLPTFKPKEFYNFCYDEKKIVILSKISQTLVNDTLKVKDIVEERGKLIDKSLYYLIIGILAFMVVLFGIIF